MGREELKIKNLQLKDYCVSFTNKIINNKQNNKQNKQKQKSMGKSNYNPLGQWRGHVGGLMFKVFDGKQVIAPYEKRRRNDRTPQQLQVRAKFGLAGKLSKIIPSEVLVGMGGNGVQNRSAIMKKAVTNAVVTVEGGEYTAVLAPEKLVLSEGMSLLLSSTPTIAATGVVSGTIGDVPEEVSGIMVVALVANAEGEYISTVYDVVVPSEGTASYSLKTGATRVGTGVNVYTIPMTLTAEGQNLMAREEYAQEEAGYALSLVMQESSSAVDYKHSQYVGSATISE